MSPADGGRTRLARTTDGAALNVAGIEAVAVNPRGGADGVRVDELGGTVTTRVDVDDHAVAGVGAPRRVGDRAGHAQAGARAGQRERVVARPTRGTDTIDADATPAEGVALTLAGDDTDLNEGGDGSDTSEVNGGGDAETFTVMESQAGTDRLLFNGSAGMETFDASNLNGRLRFTRNLGNIVMDVDDVEVIDLNAFGAADTVNINDLSGTDVTSALIDLAAPGGGSDSAADNVVVNGTNGDDVIVLSGAGAAASVSGLKTTVSITAGETLNDRLTVSSVGGDDIINASAVTSGALALTLNGGDDDDVLTGGDNNDTINGGNGDDVLIGGPGTDTLDGGTGSNVVVQD